MSNIAYPQPSAPYGYNTNPPPYNPHAYTYGKDWPPVYQNPQAAYDAPPAYEAPSAYQAPRVVPGRETNFEKENCCICLSPLSEVADDDEDKKFEVAKTKCDHYFHNFCIQKFLTDGVNEKCPLCRTELHAREISVIKLGARKVEAEKPIPVQQNAQEVANAAESTLANIGNGALWSAKLVGRTLGYIGSAVLNTLSPPATIVMAEQQSASTINKLHKFNKDIKLALDEQKECVSVLIATINSVAVKNPDFAYYTFKRIDGALDNLKLQFQKSQDELNAFLAKEQSYLQGS